MTAPTAPGTPAPDFSLPSTEGMHVSLADVADAPALLVVFMCNHCPYVRYIETTLGALTAEYAEHGLATIGISANDTVAHPDDDLAHMSEQVVRAGFTFPYLYDEAQLVARAFGATCTPDLFLYDAEQRLAYRGEFDSSRLGSDIPVTGNSMRSAVQFVLSGMRVPLPHQPGVGCSIKWRPGK